MVMFNDDPPIGLVEEAGMTEIEAPAPKTTANGAKPAKAAKAPKKQARKAAVKAAGKRKAKTAGKVRAKRKATSKPRTRDPAKLDQFGLRLGSIKSQAAALYAKGRGATLTEVRDTVGSTQFNVLSELEGRGYKLERSKAKGDVRPVTRYRIIKK